MKMKTGIFELNYSHEEKMWKQTFLFLMSVKDCKNRCTLFSATAINKVYMK